MYIVYVIQCRLPITFYTLCYYLIDKNKLTCSLGGSQKICSNIGTSFGLLTCTDQGHILSTSSPDFVFTTNWKLEHVSKIPGHLITKQDSYICTTKCIHSIKYKLLVNSLLPMHFVSAYGMQWNMGVNTIFNNVSVTIYCANQVYWYSNEGYPRKTTKLVMSKKASQFYWWMKPEYLEKTMTCGKSLTNFIT